MNHRLSSDALTALAHLPALTHLDLAGCTNIDDSGNSSSFDYFLISCFIINLFNSLMTSFFSLFLVASTQAWF